MRYGVEPVEWLLVRLNIKDGYYRTNNIFVTLYWFKFIFLKALARWLSVHWLLSQYYALVAYYIS